MRLRVFFSMYAKTLYFRLRAFTQHRNVNHTPVCVKALKNENRAFQKVPFVTVHLVIVIFLSPKGRFNAIVISWWCIVIVIVIS